MKEKKLNASFDAAFGEFLGDVGVDVVFDAVAPTVCNDDAELDLGIALGDGLDGAAVDLA